MDLFQFQNWHLLYDLSLRDIPEAQWDSGSVYVFREQSTEEVLYIGSTENLIGRFFGNYFAGFGGATTQRIQALLLDEGFIKDTEVAWKMTPDCRGEEKRLRKAYFEEHGKLPRWNLRL